MVRRDDAGEAIGAVAEADEEAFGGPRPASKRRGRCVLHVDADAFFAQVEARRDESLRGIPLAIRQHGDIVCVCHRARALGARKHGDVEACKALLEEHGGKVVHVNTTEDHLVSYEPYTRASYEFHAKMHAICERLRVDGKNVIYEKASIDEAYVQIEHGAKPSERGKAVAESIRRAVFDQCGLVVSVGVARNKLLAKIASKCAKPDGIVIIENDEDFEQRFRDLPSSELPHCKSEFVRAKLNEYGLRTAWDVRSMNAKRLEALIGLAPRLALELCKAAHGVDDTEVIQRVNEKASLSSQMTLAVKQRPMPRNLGNAVAVTGGPAGFFNPLTCAEHDRIGLTVTSLSRDLCEKIRVHENYTKRWPTTIAVKIKMHGTSVQYSKTAAFPVKFDDTAFAEWETVVGKKATDLALLAVGQRKTDIIHHVAVSASNFKSSMDENEKTRDALILAEADPLKKALDRMNEKRERDKKAQRFIAKRQRNERWIEASEPLPPVDMLLALVGGWQGDEEEECILEVAECRRALANRQMKCSERH